MEMRLGLFDRDGEGVVVSVAADGALALGGKAVVGCLPPEGALNLTRPPPPPPKTPPKVIPGGAKNFKNFPRRERLEPRLIAVAAFVAAETKLEPSIGRKVIEIGC